MDRDAPRPGVQDRAPTPGLHGRDQARVRSDRSEALNLTGVGLFAFIPFVLFLFLRLPFGPGASLLLGLALMLGHRFVAAPWAVRHGRERCLWCGRAAPGIPVEIVSGGRTWALAACGVEHARRVGRFVTFVRRARWLLLPGIFLPLMVLLCATAALALGGPFMAQEWAAQQFRMIVAASVVGASVGYLAVREPERTLSFPFPLHNLCLLGIRSTLWVFRLVGAWWLLAGTLHLTRGAG